MMDMQECQRPDDIPIWVWEDLQRYINNLQPPGFFIRAILENNLVDSVIFSDSKESITHIVLYLYYNAPSICWGSPEKVQAWLNSKLH